ARCAWTVTPLFGCLRRARGTRGLGSLLLRLHLRARTRLHEATDDNAVIRSDSILDGPQTDLGNLAERHVFKPRSILIVDDDDEPARLFGADRGVRDQQCLVRRRAGYANARKHSGREYFLGIRNDRAAADGTGGTVDDVVDEIHPALVIAIRFIDQLELHLHAGVAAGNILACIREPLV